LLLVLVAAAAVTSTSTSLSTLIGSSDGKLDDSQRTGSLLSDSGLSDRGSTSSEGLSLLLQQLLLLLVVVPSSP
jgi:hypothetical protein